MMPPDNFVAAAMFQAQQQQHAFQIARQQGMMLHVQQRRFHQHQLARQQQQQQQQQENMQAQKRQLQHNSKHNRQQQKPKKPQQKKSPTQSPDQPKRPPPKHLNKEEKRKCFQKLWASRRVTLESPTVKTLPSGMLQEVAQEFGIGRQTVSGLWKQTHARLSQADVNKDDEEELQKYIIDHQATLFATNHVQKRGAPSKWDPEIMRQAIFAIPLAEQRSIRSLSVALDIPHNTLRHFIEKEGIFEALKEQRKGISYKEAKKQLEQESREKKRKRWEEGHEEQEDKPKLNWHDRKSTQQTVLETTRLTALIGDHARCAECGEGSLELSFVTTHMMSLAKGQKVLPDSLAVSVPKLECHGCQFVAFPGNVTSKVISTPRCVGGPIGSKSDNKHHHKYRRSGTITSTKKCIDSEDADASNADEGTAADIDTNNGDPVDDTGADNTTGRESWG